MVCLHLVIQGRKMHGSSTTEGCSTMNMENALEESLLNIDPTEGPVTRVNTSMIVEAIKDIKTR